MTKTPEELTKEWKAGELEDGLYYILLENGKTPIAELETWCRYDDEVEEPYKTSQEFFGYPKDIISEVLSPIPSYNHFADLRKKAEKYDRIKVNGNYPDKISKLKSRIKKLLEEKDHFIELTEKIKTLSSENERLLNLQAVTNKEIEELESDSLAKKEGEEIVAELTNGVTHEFVHSAVNFVVNHFFWQFNDFSVCNSQFKRSTFNSIVKCDFFS